MSTKENNKQKLFEAFDKLCGTKLLKEEKSPKDLLKQHLIELIDLDNYDDLNQYAKGDEKIIELFKTFKSEKDWDIKQSGLKKALENWLRGMPTILDAMPIYYDEIKNLLYSIGIIDSRDVDDDVVDKLYYNTIVDIILDTVK